MDEGSQGLIIFFLITIIASLIIHYLYRSYLLASLVSALLSSMVFQLAEYLHQGYLGTLALVAFIFSSLYALGISLIIGLPFKWVRSKRMDNNKA